MENLKAYTRQEKELRIKKAILIALKRNPFTAHQTIKVHVQGLFVTLMGTVDTEELIYEAVITAESVSPKLEVFSELMVTEPTFASTHVLSAV